MSLKIATLYHAQKTLDRGGLTTYLNNTKTHCNKYSYQFDNYAFYKYMSKNKIINKNILDNPIEVYCNKNKLLEKLNEYDIVINYFPIMNLNNEEIEDSFKDFVFDIWKNIKGVKVLQEHTAMYGNKIKLNKYGHDLIKYCDVVMTRSNQNPFAQYAIQNFNKPWQQLKLYYDFDQFDKVPKKNKIVSFGRNVTCKKLKFLKEAQRYLEQYMEVQPSTGVMKYEDGLKMFAESKILFCPTLAKEGYEYANQLEYVQMEGLANDCILVLNKHQGENCYHEGSKWIDIPNFALWFDEKDLEWTWNQIIETMKDPDATKKFILAKNKFREELKISNFKKQMNYIKNIK